MVEVDPLNLELFFWIFFCHNTRKFQCVNFIKVLEYGDFTGFLHDLLIGNFVTPGKSIFSRLTPFWLYRPKKWTSCNFSLQNQFKMIQTLFLAVLIYKGLIIRFPFHCIALLHFKRLTSPKQYAIRCNCVQRRIYMLQIYIKSTFTVYSLHDTWLTFNFRNNLHLILQVAIFSHNLQMPTRFV